MKPAMTGPRPKRGRTVERTCGWKWGGVYGSSITPLKTCHLKRDHVQKERQTSSNQMDRLVFWGEVVAGKELQQWIVVGDTKTSHMCNERISFYIIQQRVFGGVLGKDLQQWIVIVVVVVVDVVDVVVGDTIYDQSQSSCTFWNKTKRLL